MRVYLFILETLNKYEIKRKYLILYVYQYRQNEIAVIEYAL